MSHNSNLYESIRPITENNQEAFVNYMYTLQFQLP